jgi:hypothetical protein
MATVPSHVPYDVNALLAAVKQLPPAELREFQRQFAAWSGQDSESNGTLGSKDDDNALLAAIRDNSALPSAEQRRFNRLRRKRQDGTLTEAEEEQLQALWRQVEQMDATHLEALGALAHKRGTDVRTVMRQLGLSENRDVF